MTNRSNKVAEALAKVTRETIKDRETALAIEVELDMIASALAKDGHVAAGADFLTAIALLVKMQGLNASVLETAAELENLLADVHYSTDRYAQDFLADIERAYHEVITQLEAWHKKRATP